MFLSIYDRTLNCWRQYGRSDAMIGSSPILEPSLISSVCPQVAPTYRLVPNSKEMDEDMK
jgi:hypothetical protein